MNLILNITITVAAVFAPALHASTVSLDTVYVSTINGQSTSNGISISSYVYMMSGSSLTLQGSGGYVTSGSSITASAFFGNGSNLTRISILTATQTFTGANTFISSFTVQTGGNQIILSTSTSANNISISSQGALSFSPFIHTSSSTTIPEYSTTITTFGVCVPGSTITITTAGGQVEVSFTGTISANTGAFVWSHSAINFLQDGNFVRDLSATKGVLADYETGPNPPTANGICNFNYLLDAPAPGAHSYCITIRGTDSSQATTLGNGNQPDDGANIFYVKELK